MVRGISIELNNTNNSPEAGLAILTGLQKYESFRPPTDVQEQLDEDFSTIGSNLKWEEITSAMERSDLEAALKLADELLSTTSDEEERTTLEGFKILIEKRKSSKKRKYLFWAAAAAIFIGWIAIDEMDTNKNKSSRNRQYSSATPKSNYTPNSNSKFRATKPTSKSFIEVKPPVGQGLSLSLNQVRYCVFQRERLVHIKTIKISSSENAKFNILINDYNSRCSNYQYRRGSISKARSDLDVERTRIHKEGTRIVNMWRQSSKNGASITSSKNISASNKKFGRLLNKQKTSDVKIIQKKLASLGYYDGIIDGIWGGNSKFALSSFKLQNGLGYNEIWDEKTQKKLFPGR